MIQCNDWKLIIKCIHPVLTLLILNFSLLVKNFFKKLLMFCTRENQEVANYYFDNWDQPPLFKQKGNLTIVSLFDTVPDDYLTFTVVDILHWIFKSSSTCDLQIKIINGQTMLVQHLYSKYCLVGKNTNTFRWKQMTFHIEIMVMMKMHILDQTQGTDSNWHAWKFSIYRQFEIILQQT